MISATGEVNAWEGFPSTGVSADFETKLDGRQSLRIEHPTWEGNLRLLQNVVGAAPLTRYRLRGYLKCENLPQLAFFSVQTGRNLRVTHLAGLGDGVFQTQDWKEFAIDFTTPSEHVELAIEVNCDKPMLPDRPVGTLWIDGLSLVAITNEQ